MKLDGLKRTKDGENYNKGRVILQKFRLGLIRPDQGPNQIRDGINYTWTTNGSRLSCPRALGQDQPTAEVARAACETKAAAGPVKLAAESARCLAAEPAGVAEGGAASQGAMVFFFYGWEPWFWLATFAVRPLDWVAINNAIQIFVFIHLNICK